jgi:hypothetical protein
MIPKLFVDNRGSETNGHGRVFGKFAIEHVHLSTALHCSKGRGPFSLVASSLRSPLSWPAK